jgi:hypothetical protein
MCCEISDFGLVCRDSKSFGRDLENKEILKFEYDLRINDFWLKFFT